MERSGATRLALCVAATLGAAACMSSPPGSFAPSHAGDDTPAVSPAAVDRSPSASGRGAATLPPTQGEIETLMERVALEPTDGEAQRDLGFALLQRVRETADPSLYEPAEVAFSRARALRPGDPLVVAGIAALHLARHDFTAALATAEEALAIEAASPSALAIKTDALIELGRYEEAVETAQQLVDASEDLVSLARVSYLRELHGDLPGAVEAMAAAASSPSLAAENTAYVTTLLGTLLGYVGKEDEAEAAYAHALTLVPDHPPALAGLARAALRRGDHRQAIEHLERATAIVPLPEYVIALGEAQELAGDGAAAAASYDLARAQIALYEASGVDVGVELALFEADHGDPAEALRLAEAAYARRATIRTADALGWALHRSGRSEEARERAREALRLGTQEPLLLYHAGMIEAALDEDAAARDLLQRALELDAGFSALGARAAAETLDRIGP